MKYKGLLVLLVLMGIIVFSGCRQESAPGNYTDDLGRSVQISKTPERIISLAPSNTEIVYALGLQDRLIGVTTFCNYPPEVKQKPAVSEFSNVDIEKIVSLKPDLILADSIHKPDVIPALEKLNIPVLGIDPKNLDNIISDIELIGKVTGETKNTATLVASLQDRIQTVNDKNNSLNTGDKPGVFFLSWHDPLWTTGSGTLINDLIIRAGGNNIAYDLNGHSQIDIETVIQRNPQIIFVLSSMGEQNMSYEYLMKEPRFQATDCLKNRQVYEVDTDIFGRTTPRTVDALEQMAKLIHPDLYKW